MKKLLTGLAMTVLCLGFSSFAVAYTISDSATGGDCTQIGVWDSATKTCTLTQDISHTWGATVAIDITSNGITFDGNGYNLADNPAGSYDAWIGPIGIRVLGRKGVLIKNLRIEYFNPGIMLLVSHESIIENNVLTGGATNGIFLNTESINNIVRGNIVTDKRHGIYLSQNLHPINTGNIIEKNIISNNTAGLFIEAENYIVIKDNNIFENTEGIVLGSGQYSVSYATITGNTIEDNAVGLRIPSGWEPPNTVYNNNFINNIRQVASGRANIFSLEAPIGGNYWSNFDSPEEGCTDANSDGFCDAPYDSIFYQSHLGDYNNVFCKIYPEHHNCSFDYLPWTKQNGWLKPATISDLMEKVNALYAAGEITNRGIYNSLISKLSNALDAKSQGDALTAIELLT